MALKLTLLFIIVLLATSSYAQKIETMERANAVPFPSNGKLVLEYTGVKENLLPAQSAIYQ